MRALVTGASRGIGKALLTEGSDRGYEVLGTTRDGAGLALDVTDPAAQRRLAHEVGPLDLLVCNAGVFLDRGKDIESLTADDLNQSFAVNVTGVFLTVQAQLANLPHGARVAVIASQMGSSTQATGDSFAYRVTKAAAINLSLNLAQALAPRGVAVGVYHPGWVRTDMGGASAAISVETSAKGLWDRFEGLSLATTGAFETYDGHPHPI